MIENLEELKKQSPWLINFNSIKNAIENSSKEIGIENEIEKLKEKSFNFTLMPEPYLGNPYAKIYLLNLNPAVDDLLDLKDPPEIKPIWNRYKEHVLCNYVFYDEAHCNFSEKLKEYRKFPFYHLDPYYKYFQGFWWWYKKLNPLIEKVIENLHISTDKALEKLANSIFNVELISYHSNKFINLPKEILENFESSKYNRELVEKALDEGKIIIVMQGYLKWIKFVPRLSSSNNVYKLKSRNSVISDNNIITLSEESSEKSTEIFKKLIGNIKDH
ncbi:MAG: hypothetical protein ACP5IB_05915 [Thermoplasmata archaeon]